MTDTTTGTPSRRLYKLLRGSISRREGDKQPFVDPETGQRTKRKSRPFVHYSAKSMRNPNAKDEILLTDAEARAFGRQNLRELMPKEVRTRDIEPEKIDEMLERELPEDTREKIDMLIEEGRVIRRNRQLQIWRKRVFEAAVLDGEVPAKRLDVIDMLNRVEVSA